MSDRELDRIVAEAAPIGDAEVAALDLAAGESELIEEIMATPPTSTEDAPTAAPRADAPIPERRRRRRRHRPRLRAGGARLGAGLAAASAVAALVLAGVGLDRGEDDGQSAFAAELVRVAEANPRLLVTAPGWEVTRADELKVDVGEMTFSDGEHELDVFWRPARYYEGDLHDPEFERPNREIELLGGTVTLIRYRDTTDYKTLLPPEGETYTEIRGDLGGEEAYLEVVRSIERADVETWLAAMPASVVAPSDRGTAVDEMLEGLPLPPGLDVAKLRRGEVVSDRYQLGAAVTGAIACGWFDEWLTARAAGDADRERKAVDAMASSRRWPILEEMRPQGGWSPVVWELADAMAAGQRTLPAGKDLPIEKWAASALGCSYR